MILKATSKEYILAESIIKEARIVEVLGVLMCVVVFLLALRFGLKVIKCVVNIVAFILVSAIVIVIIFTIAKVLLYIICIIAVIRIIVKLLQ